MTNHHDILGRMLAELPRAVGALCETSASKRPATAPVQDGFVVTIQGAGDVHGELRLYFDRAGATAIAKAASGSALEPNDTVVAETLKTLCARLCGSLDPQHAGAAFVVAAAGVATLVPAIDPQHSIDVVVKGLEQVLRIAGAGLLEWSAAHPASREGKTLDVIMDIDLPLVVRFGRTELPLKTLTTLGPGSVIDLGRAPDDPVEVLISNRVVARGEVVIVAGSYGVRVHDVVSPAERARSVEAELV
jgi:flagellar motor switch protein FliN